jgi:Leucine-rich repeat (LRR) protein
MAEEKNIIEEDSGVVGARTINSEDNIGGSSKVNIPNNKDEKGKNPSTIDTNEIQNGQSNVSIPKSSEAAKKPHSRSANMSRGKLKELKKRLDQKVNKRITVAKKNGILDFSSTSNFSFDFETIPTIIYETFGTSSTRNNEATLPVSTEEKTVEHASKSVGVNTNSTKVNLRQLWLSKNLITTISFDIKTLTSLHTLSLSHNHLSSVPSEIGMLQNLHRLFLDGNKLTGLPAHIVKLEKLEELRLDRNAFPMFPLEISMLRSLIRLGLSDNDIENVPGDIMYLTKLIELELDNNKLSSLPDSISRLAPSLQVLGLAHNHFSEIPQCVHELVNLDILRLHGNRSAEYEVVDKETGFVSEGRHIPLRHDGYLEYRSGHTIVASNGKEEHVVEFLDGYLEESILQNRENADWLRREDELDLVQVLKNRAKRKEWKTRNRMTETK